MSGIVSRPDLGAYHAKRDFRRTAEPEGQVRAGTGGHGFVVQKHAATRLHWDFRLEWQGVLLSWAVTRGPSADPSARRLAVRTEDHPLDYAGFEGTIPKGEYGGGTVMLWDRGTWSPLGDVAEGLREGRLKFVLQGERMRGAWMLVRMKPRKGERSESWLLIKEHDDHESDEAEELVRSHLTSVTTGRSMEQIASGAKPRKPLAPQANPPAFRPLQLARLVPAAPEGDEWLHETKFDGYRCLAALGQGAVRLYTRTGLDWTDRFGSLVPDFGRLKLRSALIDGEVIAPGVASGGFSDLQARLKTGLPLAFMAFDLLELDGADLAPRPLLERKARLERLIGAGVGAIRFSTHILGHGDEVHRRMCEAAQEGIVSKRASSPYSGSRNGDWLKVKCGLRQEFVICGWTPSTKPGRPFASLVMGSFEDGRLVYRGNVGTGFGAGVFRRLMPLLKARAQRASPFSPVPAEAKGARWVRPDLVAEVKLAELTADGRIRHGVFVGLREDKPAPEVHLERPETEETMPQPSDEVRVAGVRISHPERRIFDRPPVTKLEVAQHYEALAPRILPFLKDRPVSLLRCPDGAGGECFFQKHRTKGMPEAIRTVTVDTKDGPEEFVTLPDAAALVAAAQMGAIEFHIWGSRNRTLDRPDRMVFDLDPDEGLGFDRVRAAAEELRERLEALGLPSVPMLSGGKGIHVIVPLKPKAAWDSVKLFSRALATILADEAPERYTATMSKAERKGRIFIDWLRNDRGATAVAPYGLRARPGATVAVPMTWEELGQARSAGDWDIRSVRDRLTLPCPLAEGGRKAVTLGPAVLRRLERHVAAAGKEEG
ncbi:DNA ligase D [Cereibacter sphaeroides]|uniref:DNA ligase D n=1 Tax=Cereibacter sphaeroides TaxID=1063 RepID=UPI001F472548|nr:DNA ligase D [Cereibacter sphaeroides]MCE6968064.1 DNA ligase D [Cereibacter sphaeroides]